jgi:hypothetical protein
MICSDISMQKNAANPKTPPGAVRVLSVLVVILALVSACGGKAPIGDLSSTAPTTTAPYAVFGNLSAKLYGLATFEGYDQTFSYPIQFEIPPISITWMGTIFNGLLQGAGAGLDTTYQVHGNVSADGKWIESMSFSQEITGPSGYSGNFFRVTLQNVPLIQTLDASGNAKATSNKVGTDVQRFVTKVEYQAASTGFSYISTDLADTTYVASLDVALATGPGSEPGTGATQIVSPMM